MAIPVNGYDIKKELGRNAARVILYNAELDFKRKLQICQDKVNAIAKNQIDNGANNNDDRDFLVLKWFIVQVVNSLADYAKRLQEYYKNDPEEFSSLTLHTSIMEVKALTQYYGGLDQTERDLNLFHQYIINDLVEKAINNYSANSLSSLNNLATALYLADQLGFNDLPVVIRAYNNIINKLPEINTPLKIKESLN